MVARPLQSGLADAANLLNSQLCRQLASVAALLLPHVDSLDASFTRHLRELRHSAAACRALCGITLGAAAKLLAQGQELDQFLGHVSQLGRTMAKLNLTPNTITSALDIYDQLIMPLLHTLPQREVQDAAWVREQIQFAALLSLNGAYYSVQQEEARVFAKLLHMEWKPAQLDSMLVRFLDALTSACEASEGCLVLLSADSAQEGFWETTSIRTQGRHRKAERLQLPAETVDALSRPRLIRVTNRSTALLADSSWAADYAFCWSVPLISPEQTVTGFLQLSFQEPRAWLPRERLLLMKAVESCRTAIERLRLLQDLSARERQISALGRRLLHAEELERHRISRELHDEAGQSLLCIRMQLEMMEQSTEASGGRLREQLASTRQLAETTIIEIRRMIAALSPAPLETLGLETALRQMVGRIKNVFGGSIRIQIGHLPRLPHATQIIVYRLAQECCNNAVKHSSATSLNISVSYSDKNIRLAVADDGVGFDVHQALSKQDSFGLSGMRERLALLGGNLEVESRHEGKRSCFPSRTVSDRVGKGRLTSRAGTHIKLTIPVEPEAAAGSQRAS